MKAGQSPIIIRPLITEKGVESATHNHTYHFEVARWANKAQIREAVERLFNVHVVGVRTDMRKGKPRRVRFKRGHTPPWKRAAVKLVPGDSIELI